MYDRPRNRDLGQEPKKKVVGNGRGGEVFLYRFPPAADEKSEASGPQFGTCHEFFMIVPPFIWGGAAHPLPR